ncbi:MAG: VPDSG-CTERM sorting domain-containing protein [Bryobacterales bacterium]|nr:VPDSG-CTERM sorting domain-containing protein [Opitutaceae bacterium]MCZ2154969.1 VPDSG-CTERM sorting domain-containing protein [Bryobacterales bacterium]
MKLVVQAASALTALLIAAPGFGQVVVNSFQTPVASGSEVPDAWYSNDVRTGGTATIVDLSGVGGNLENNQPLPTGAARLTTDGTTAAKAEVTTYRDFGAASSVLADISLGYSYFKSPTSETAAAPSIKLLIAGPGSGDNYGALVYEPYWNLLPNGAGTPTQGDWINLSIDQNTGSGNDNAGGWWWNGGFEIPSGAGGPPLRSLAEWATAFQSSDPIDFPNARVIGLQMGIGTYNINQDDYFDNVSINTGSTSRTYNFEVRGATSVPDTGSTALLLGAGLLALFGISRRRQAS